MDLFIETLTGTAFELRVSPFETIMSVKAKIQRLEGELNRKFGYHRAWEQVRSDLMKNRRVCFHSSLAQKCIGRTFSDFKKFPLHVRVFEGLLSHQP